MKDVLIYGALVAAMVGASVPVIQNLQATVNTQGTTINSEINTELAKLVSDDSSSS